MRWWTISWEIDDVKRVWMRVGIWLLGAAAWAGCLVTNTQLEPDRDCTGQCAVRPMELQGAKQPGERCTYAQECLPVCCACGTDTQDTVLLASCRLGVCMAREDVCSLNTVGTLCGRRRDGILCPDRVDAGR